MKKLVTYCYNCNSRIKIKKNANDRVELKMQMGNKISLTCSKCKLTNDYHINKIVATHTIVPLITLISTLVIIPILLYYLWTNGFLKFDHILYNGGLIGSVIVLPSAFYLVVDYNENKQIRLFNRYRVKEE